MKYVFFDLGAYDGDTIKHFRRKRNLPVPVNQFEIHAFEPNPKFTQGLRDTLSKHKGEWSLDSRAIWTDNEDREFAVDGTATPMGSTLMSGKTAIWDTMEHVKVPCIDFSEFLKNFEDYHVIIKMDIEGAEFPVLEKMLNNGTIDLVNELWCEFHPNKVKEYTTTYCNDLKKRLRRRTRLTVWH